MPLKWTKRSRPPPSGVMNPKPFSSENHLTVPVPTDTPLAARRSGNAVLISTGRQRRPRRTETVYRWRLYAQASRLAPAWRSLLAERLRGVRDLFAVARRGVPRKPQWIARVA